MTAPESAARRLPYVMAVNEAITQLMREDPAVFLAGEDVALYGSVFGISRNLLAEFGPERVVDTPIAEAGIMGLGIGAAATGLRPIIDIMFMDFMTVCMDQLVNQAAKMKYMFGGKARLPLTIHTMAGGGRSMAAQHSQSLEAWFCHVPGLKVVMPSGAYEAKGLMVAAVRDDNPVIVVNQKALLGASAPVPEELYEIPLGVANIVRPGSNFTIVALGAMVPEALKAAETLAEDGLDVEVIDPRTLQPFDTGTVVASVRKTHRALVAHEAVRFGGLGAEIAAQIQEEAFDHLDAPVGRVGAPFSPVPFSPVLESHYVPTAETIVTEVRRLLGRQA
ncbi:alpha-ketoacid dehydrogenase subunit beta [Candidatus Amarobacter glycogenicus]|jgi:pyruvate/2-oxoglutarate/acetoin dehydrogenase E1 component|uniref:alpha-ketoacid dehydrogenase subunit beta n=1 Tax=Candidatus Amarobacter glycogenicus TaxID=3140699 RepID=UPI0031CCD853